MELPLPPLLSLLLERGIWPRTREEARGQNQRPRVELGRIQALAPRRTGSTSLRRRSRRSGRRW
ncbi:hypothetical protein [Nannocystis pusilla]|uniref:hypothetical protein n=1 Tax=Nannocystis pusilla TaxID=889268 RepID=UPI003B7D3511